MAFSKQSASAWQPLTDYKNQWDYGTDYCILQTCTVLGLPPNQAVADGIVYNTRRNSIFGGFVECGGEFSVWQSGRWGKNIRHLICSLHITLFMDDFCAPHAMNPSIIENVWWREIYMFYLNTNCTDFPLALASTVESYRKCMYKACWRSETTLIITKTYDFENNRQNLNWLDYWTMSAKLRFMNSNSTEHSQNEDNI